MPTSRLSGPVLAGALVATLGVTVVAGASALGAAAPAAVVPTTPTQADWADTAFAIPAGVRGAARIAVSAGDRELIDWSVKPATPNGNWSSGVAVVRHGAHLVRATTVPWTVAATPTVDHKGNGLLLATTRGQYERTGLGYASVSSSGKVGARVSLTKAGLADGQAVALSENDKGAAVAAWIEGGGENALLRAATRPAGKSSFGKPFKIFGGPNVEVDGVSSAIDATGHVAVVFGGRPAGKKRASRGLYVAAGLAGKRSLGAPILAGPQDGNPRTSATFTSGGRLDVAWGSQISGEEADSPYVVRAASLGRGARRFGDVQTLDDGAAKNFPQGGLQIVPGPGSSSLVAWNAVGPKDTFPVRMAMSNPFGQFGDPTTIAKSAELGGIAQSRSAAVVTVEALGDDAITAAVRLPGGLFSAPGPVAPFVRDEGAYAQPLGALTPAPVFSPALLGDVSRAMIARVVVDAAGKAQLVLTQRLFA